MYTTSVLVFTLSIMGLAYFLLGLVMGDDNE